MHSNKIGDTFTAHLLVEIDHTASAFGSGSLHVFSTPMMIGLMENAALNCVQSGLVEGYTTVGTQINVSHIAATPMGQTVTAKAELVKIEGKKLSFHIEAFDEAEKIGFGTHERYIINSEQFLEKVNHKIKNV